MDNDCVKDKKCCSNGCYKICVAPSPEAAAAAGRIISGIWSYAKALLVIPRGGSISYNGQYGDVPPERGTFLRLEV